MSSGVIVAAFRSAVVPDATVSNSYPELYPELSKNSEEMKFALEFAVRVPMEVLQGADWFKLCAKQMVDCQLFVFDANHTG